MAPVPIIARRMVPAFRWRPPVRNTTPASPPRQAARGEIFFQRDFLQKALSGRSMLDKTMPSLTDAVSGIRDGATLLIGGFGGSGIPTALLRALLDQGASDLTIVNNN